MPNACTASSIAGNEQLVACLPHVLGFAPSDSLVLAWFRGGCPESFVTYDLAPLRAAEGDALDRWADSLVTRAVREGVDSLVAVLIPDPAEPVDDGVRLADRVCDRVHRAGLPILDLLGVRSGRWRSLYCDDAACCTAAGRALSRQALRRAAAIARRDVDASTARRPGIRTRVARDPWAVSQVSAVLPVRPRRPRRGDGWRDAAIEEVTDLLLGPSGVVEPAQRARVMRALLDVRVRDTVLWEIGHASADGVDRAASALSALTRSAPDVILAPVATCCAVALWLAGDAAGAIAAVDRALAVEPAYNLAHLVRTALRAGWPPDRWRQIVADLDRGTCRRGLLPPAA